ncbi:hypothetical protein PAE0931 [Pyrobaculum aerophilum str. IM2]|uniref:Uncharacterized protein n=2 Tax=Pyrobaculum aerophilum TaxID=13773 RepID=Q8ZY62_PYRAE|nr:hypothetical protein [Pyrobaculum aerophilum]AAL63134.1 hypothetical protein PAE0931 [Pyrobaculum aerophilum str. IM2]HII48102.1 hypothetical protein [Pyrobaculum aerophilum]
MESIDMLVAFTLVAMFMLSIYVLSNYFAASTQQVVTVAGTHLDAQEVLKKILTTPGSPPDWTDLNQVEDLGLADPSLPGQLDSRKLLALAVASGVGAEALCRINVAGQDVPVTKIGYGIYLWGAPQQQSIDPSVYERILRSLFGADWDKYDMEIYIRPALNINIELMDTQALIRVSPPGIYSYHACVFYWPQYSTAQYSIEILGAYYYKKGNKWNFTIALYNDGVQPATITSIEFNGVNLLSAPITINPGDVYCPDFQLSGEPANTRVVVRGEGIYAEADAQKTKPHGRCKPPDKNAPATAPQVVCVNGETGDDGIGAIPVPGGTVFAFAYVRGVAVRGANYTYYSPYQISLVGLVARQNAGVYVVHSKLIQSATSTSLCGCDDPGVSALGLRYIGVFLGGKTVPLVQSATINPGSSVDFNEVCNQDSLSSGACLIPWSFIGRAKFLIATVERNSQGDPPKCNGIPQRDVIVMPLTGGLPPLYEIHFATWKRWTDKRPEALAVSHASALADAGEVTYIVDLWVFRR